MNNTLPSRQQALKILREAGCTANVIAHCEAVSKLAVKIAEACKAKGKNIDLHLVEVGALLHDIGRANTHKINHGIVGAELARSKNLPEPIIRIIERHVLAGITAQEAKEFGLPAQDHLPETMEEKIITYSDKRVHGQHYVNMDVTIQKLSRWLGSNHSIIKRLKQLHEEITAIVGEAI